ncbi:MAG: Hsp33 family molecular chaperone HslO [Endozoicomonadaceae bacterium]|nr:Hsp33 family molecular chaperone HslO [Endozoicomonadaceae bacterium]
MDTDYTQRFLFEQTNVRGEHVYLGHSFADALKFHKYPLCIKKLLGQMSVAAILLSSTLKFSGIFTLQARSSGPVSLLMAECTHQQYFRILARFNDSTPLPDDASLAALLPQGQLLISVDTEKTKRYQSIVALNQSTLDECFTAYFRQSEQLPTKLWLTANDKQAAGFLLQSLPTHENKTDVNTLYKKINDWEHATILADTLREEELLSPDTPALLSRLFHEDDLRIFEKTPVSFRCPCSKERISRSLLALGEAELKGILAEQRHIDTYCQFCNHQYYFSEEEIFRLIKNSDADHY